MNIVQSLFQTTEVSSIIALVLAVAWIIGYGYFLKQRTRKQLQARQEIINNQRHKLNALLQEKEWLLQEVHHRVRNNLQIVISLLNTQSAYLDNEDAIRAIRNSQNRMYAMSLIHHKLYQPENISAIDMAWYIRGLMEYMRQTFDTGTRIDFVLDTECIKLDIAQAIPVGLVLNEAVSNAIKYAFTERSHGTVTVALKQHEANRCQLTVADNGIGVPPGFNTATKHSLGINLMRGLTEQLDGVMEIQNNRGWIVHITFPIQTLRGTDLPPSPSEKKP